jgi:hypothetical protein
MNHSLRTCWLALGQGSWCIVVTVVLLIFDAWLVAASTASPIEVIAKGDGTPYQESEWVPLQSTGSFKPKRKNEDVMRWHDKRGCEQEDIIYTYRFMMEVWDFCFKYILAGQVEATKIRHLYWYVLQVIQLLDYFSSCIMLHCRLVKTCAASLFRALGLQLQPFGQLLNTRKLCSSKIIAGLAAGRGALRDLKARDAGEYFVLALHETSYHWERMLSV